jgi:hypothetical protein
VTLDTYAHVMADLEGRRPVHVSIPMSWCRKPGPAEFRTIRTIRVGVVAQIEGL